MATRSSKSLIYSASFWDDQPARIEALRAFATKANFTKPTWKAKLRRKLIEKLKAHNLGRLKDEQIEIWPDHSWRRFFTRGVVPIERRATMSVLAADLFKSATAAGPTNTAYLEVTSSGLPDIRSEFEAYCDANDVELDLWEWRNLADAEKAAMGAREHGLASWSPFFDAFLRATQLTETQRTAEQSAFPGGLCARGQEFRRFLIYRNSISARRVSKMYGFFRRARKDFPYPTFAIWYRDDNGRIMETTSIIVGAQQAVHLFGPMGSGVGLNLISLSRRALVERSFVGLQLATDSNGIPIASRLLFVETEIEHSDQADIGIISRSGLADERLSRAQLALLSNRTGIERSDLTHLGLALTHEQTQDIIGERLASSPILMDETGGAYNPADASHIPFNTALYLK